MPAKIQNDFDNSKKNAFFQQNPPKFLHNFILQGKVIVRVPEAKDTKMWGKSKKTAQKFPKFPKFPVSFVSNEIFSVWNGS